MNIKEFENTKERISWLIENKSTLIAQKKAVLKKADALSASNLIFDKKDSVIKANEPIEGFENMSSINVTAAINTTNVIDSHMDLHVKGIWNKSVRENKNILHLQEHKMDFDSIISDSKDLKVSVKELTWKELGFDFEGNTQALIFDSTVKRDRNEKMFKQYAKGYVKNHSVGMQYVKLELAVNEPEFEKEFDFWNKYISLAINPEKAEEMGYFWVVQEAKVIEGSAVPIGSNQLTPTMENNKTKPSADTSKDEPSELDTQIKVKLNELLTKI